MQMRLVIIVFSILVRLLSTKGTHAATFTFTNRCEYTVWPGILPNAGTPGLESTGFELPKEGSRTFQAPTGWSGRFWGRTGCNFDGSGSGSCLTGDCGSGQVECNGNGAEPPATLAEFTLGTGGQDFYDVSLVDGYNLPMLVEGTGGLGTCASTGCTTDLNLQCPMELKVGSGEACKSACEAFGTPEYCCSGAYGSPNTCKPSIYSEMFKAACPRSYSYAYDDATSTFTCTGAEYTITFCPSSPSQKSSRDAMPATTGTASQEQGSVSQAGTVYPGYTFGSGSDAESGMRYQGSDYGGGLETDGSGPSGKALLADGSYLAGLAMGDSPRKYILRSALESILISLAGFYLCSFISLHYL